MKNTLLFLSNSTFLWGTLTTAMLFCTNISTSLAQQGAIAVIANNSQNSSMQELNQLIQKYQSFSVQVEQTQYKVNGKTNQYSKSSQKKAQFTFLKPLYFVWKYEAPSSQTIVSDSRYVYIYQDLLNQLVKKDAKSVLAQSPIQLIFSDKIDQLFMINKLQMTDFMARRAKMAELLNLQKSESSTSTVDIYELKAKQTNNLYQNLWLISDGRNLKYLIAETALGLTVFEFKNADFTRFEKSYFEMKKHIQVKDSFKN